MNRLDEYTPTHKTHVIEAQLTSDPKDVQFPLGCLLLDRYEVIRIIRGGMGIVYIARDTKRGWNYAVKTLGVSESDSEGNELERFVDEIERLVRLPLHPNTVQVDYVRIINNTPYVFMEYVEGSDLRQELSRAENRTLNLDLAIDYALQICEGMRSIHEEGRILHLDIKPENILISREGVIKISDFGISGPSLLLSRKKTSQATGTYLYMSPEHIQGRGVSELSDIYSFGIVFHEMLAGKLPYPFDVNSLTDGKMTKGRLLEFHRSDYDFHDQFSHRVIIEGLSSEIGTIIGHCLAKLPGSRVPSFAYLQRWIERSFGKYKSNLSPHLEELDFYRRGLSLQAIGKHSKALEYLNRALMADPLNADLWDDVANSLSALGMKEEEEVFRRKAKQIVGRV